MTHAVELPIPRDWQVFEDFCRDLFAAEWGDPEAKLHGRSGQKQHGVDVYGRRDGAWMAVQCKRRGIFPESRLTEKEIRGEVEASRKFGSPLACLIIATTAPPDTTFDQLERDLTEENGVRIVIYGWAALVALLQGHPKLFREWNRKLAGDPSSALHLPFRPLGHLLKGREAELALLEKGLAEGLNTAPTGAYAVTQRLEAVHGLGGVGKTALAVEHAWRCRERYSGVFFVRAESPELLRSGLAELAPVMKLPRLQDEDLAVGAALEWLTEHSGWLLILDNVDDEATRGLVQEVLPVLSGGRVLITSRLKSWPGRVQRIPLGTLVPEEAVAFLLERAQQRMPTADEKEVAAALAKDLGYLPLALEQAAAFVDVHGESFANYRKRLKEETGKVLEWYDREVMDYPYSIATTWQPSFDRLGPSARVLLHLVAFLAPEGIPRGYFEGEAAEAVLKGVVEDFDLDEAIRELTGYSFLQVTGAGFGVHRMVQEVVRSRLDAGSQRQWIERTLDLVNGISIEDPTDAANWSQWEILRPHALRVIDLAEHLQHASPSVSLLMNQTGLYLVQRALYPRAEIIYNRALSIAEASLGQEHPTVAIRLNNLAWLLFTMGRSSEAEPLMRQSLAIDEAFYGAEHPRVAIDLNNLAQLLDAAARFVEAEPLMRRALAIDEEHHGRIHPTVARDLNNLGQLLASTNREAEAEPLMRRALAIDSKIYGEVHPFVARDLNNLGQLLQRTARLSEAEPLIRQALRIDQEAYGTNHPVVARDLSNLALLLKATGRYPEAEPLLRQALSMSESAHGPNHPAVANRLRNLASLLLEMGRFSESEDLAYRSLQIAEAVCGPGHPDTAISLNNLASLYQATHRLSEAEPLMRRTLQIEEQHYGPNHPNVGRSLNNLASLLQQTNRLSEAEPLMRRALLIDETSYGPEHPSVARDLNNLAELLMSTGQLDEAESCFRRALRINEASYGTHHPVVATVLNNLGRLHQEWGHSSNAELLIRRALEVDEATYGENHPNVARDLNNLATLLQELKRSSEAEPLMRRALEIDEVSLGTSHPGVARDLNNLAQLLQETNRLEEAIPLMARAVAICETSLVEGHPHLQIARKNLAAMIAVQGSGKN